MTTELRALEKNLKAAAAKGVEGAGSTSATSGIGGVGVSSKLAALGSLVSGVGGGGAGGSFNSNSSSSSSSGGGGSTVASVSGGGSLPVNTTLQYGLEANEEVGCVLLKVEVSTDVQIANLIAVDQEGAILDGSEVLAVSPSALSRTAVLPLRPSKNQVGR